MNKNQLVTSIKRNVNKGLVKVKKRSPEILLIVGAVGVVTGTVMACKATTKASDISAKAKADLEQIHKVAENEEFANEYSDTDRKKDVTLVYARTGLQYVKLYAPAVIIEGASLFCMFASHHILTKRNVALAAAYATVDKGYKEYRNRVVERYGEEVDRELLNDIKAKEFETEDGNKEERKIAKAHNLGYSRTFDRSNPHWENSMDRMLTFLSMEQHYANEKLQARGYLFLNEVLEELGFPITKEGQTVGWVYDPKDVYSTDCVNFGIKSDGCFYELANDDHVEPIILLDFNVQGNILDKI